MAKSNVAPATLGNVYVRQFNNAGSAYWLGTWKNSVAYPYTEYNIKETDMRIKTGKFTTPSKIDLTTGLFPVLFSSKYHENFAGLIISQEYDEKTGLYTYQCQDWSRLYQSKFEIVAPKEKMYNLVLYLASQGLCRPWTKKKAHSRSRYKTLLSGVKPKGLYKMSLYKNPVGTNPMEQTASLIIRDKSFIEALRDLVWGSESYIDIYFNDRGILQVEPIAKSDWLNTGLHLGSYGFSDRTFKFDTTNAITGVIENGSDKQVGKYYDGSKGLLNLDLSQFFGNIITASQNSSESKTSKKSSNNTSSKVTSSDNPYGNKKKKIWINADTSSGGFAKRLGKALEKHGWSWKFTGEGPGYHYKDYWNVTKDYQVLMSVYNGACAGTLKEAYSSKIQNVLKGKGVVHVPVFDTSGRHWTDKRHKRGDFDGWYLPTAHDWDGAGRPVISDLGKFFRNNKSKYCAGPDTATVVKQFLAGGYLALNGGNTKKVTVKKNNSGTDFKSNTYNNKALRMSNARKLIHEHARDYFSCKLTLPLGNPELKKVHTNQWLFTTLPPQMDLANWTVIAEVLNSSATRYAKYVKNRWYIESNDITVRADGTGEMKLGLNAFASSLGKYQDDFKRFRDAMNKTSTSNGSSSASKKKSNTYSDDKLHPTKAGKNVGGNLKTALSKIIEGCTTEEQKAYAIYDWVDKYVSYQLYSGGKYSYEQVLTGHRANCWDTAFLIYKLCSMAKVRCEVYNGRYHFLDGTWGHLWNKLPYKGKMTFADTGRSGRNPIGNHGSGRYIVSGGGSPYRKNY